MTIGNQIERIVRTFEAPSEGESITVKGETFIREKEIHHSKGPMYLALKLDMANRTGVLVVNDDEIIVPMDISRDAHSIQNRIYQSMRAAVIQTAINVLDEVEGDRHED